ncbi:hypothetical protein Tco_0963268 [Tanacetum coccineum]
MSLPRRTSPPHRTPPAAVCRRTPPVAVFRRLPPPSLPISRRNDRLPPALPYFSLITICCQPLLPYQHDAHDNGYSQKDEKQSQKRQNWARNGKV